MKPTPYLFSGPNWLYGASGGEIDPDEPFAQFSWPNGLDGTIGVKSVPERSFIHPKKHVFGWTFFMKPAPYLFSRPNWPFGAFGG